MHRPHRPSSRHATSRSRTGLLVLLCIAQLMVILDISAVNVALPDMAKDLEISGGDIGWTITSYSLIFGSLLLLGGRAADLLGRRRVFLTGLGVFTLASLASALAGGAATLFAARAGQGLGAAMLVARGALDHHGRVHPGRRAGEGARSLGRGRRRRRGVRRPARRHAHRARRLAPDLPRQPARWRRARRRRGQDRARRLAATPVAWPRCPRRAAGHPEPRLARVRRVASRQRGVGLDADAGSRCRGARGPGGVCRARAAHRSASARGAAPRRSRRRRRVADDARRLGRPVRHVPAQLALHAERARHRPARERPGVPAHGSRHRRRRPPRHPRHQPRRRARPARRRARRHGRRDAAAHRRRRRRQLRHRPAPRHADRRRRPRRRARRRLGLGAHRRRGGGDRDALRAQHHRPRDRRLARHRRARHDRDRVAGRAGLRRRAHGGIGDAFLVAGALAAVASVLALAILPSAASFLPKLRLSPPVSVH